MSSYKIYTQDPAGTGINAIWADLDPNSSMNTIFMPMDIGITRSQIADWCQTQYGLNDHKTHWSVGLELVKQDDLEEEFMIIVRLHKSIDIVHFNLCWL